MLKIRLARHGAKKNPTYRITVIDEAKKRGGRPIEVLGLVNPKKSIKKFNNDRLNYWISIGAMQTNAVKKITK